MTMKRICKMSIDPHKRAACERAFSTISVSALNKKKSLVSLEIGKPTKSNPNDYIMISNGQDEASSITCVGEHGNEAVIPQK